jgi:hypothetical protein
MSAKRSRSTKPARSREPIYGVGEWAARHAADVLGLKHLAALQEKLRSPRTR